MISHGDIFSEQIYEDILPFTIRDDLWSIEKEYDEFKGIIYGVLFEDVDLQSYLHELIYNKNSCEIIYEFVFNEYDEMITKNKEKWKKRLEFIKLIF